jgi:hypothetical protein
MPKISKLCKQVDGGRFRAYFSTDSNLLTVDELKKLVAEAKKDFPWLTDREIVLRPTENPVAPGQVGIQFNIPRNEELPSYYEVRLISD